ncbi:hypothetical protein CspHIS471_0400120 [Cutaneotrichosporon sp. HIS471]|nr:hypothetical protein CspHIS471_0400120 [Cutaneotrichosporon sp. HIS471]
MSSDNISPASPHAPSFSEKGDANQHIEHSNQPVELERRFSFLACLGLGFSLLNSWTGEAASLSIVLSSGGSAAMVWGLLVSGTGTMMMAISLAEICHVYPLSGGQYDWAYVCAPPSIRKGVSFFTGWMACAGWTSLFAAASSLGVAFVTGCLGMWNENYQALNWHLFLIFLAFAFSASALNAFGVKLLPTIDRFAGIWGMTGIVVVSITLLACSSGRYQPPKNVFGTLTNVTGWPDGMAFILGLLQSTLGLTAFDAASHMVEEIPQPSKNAPRVMVMAVGLGTITSWIFMVVLLFCLTDFDAVAASPNGPLLTIYHQATGSLAGSTCLVIFNLLSMFFCIQAVNTVASRMIMSFSRDRGMGPLSRFLSPIHPRLKVPLMSNAFITTWVVIFGCVWLGSSVALNAILSAAILFVQLSYIVPIILVFIRGEKAFEGHQRKWSLGKWRRPINLGAIAFASITSICFLFPPAIPVLSGSSMNWAVLVLAIVMLLCGTTWLVDGHKNFHGPLDLEERLLDGKNA